MGDDIPDANRLWDFMQRIEVGRRFEEFDINPALGCQKGSEACWTKKDHESHFGRKSHVKDDFKAKRILTSKPPPCQRA